MAASNKKRKKVVIAALAVAAAILLCVFLTSRKAEEGDSYSRSMEEFYESSYLDYLEDRGFEGVMSQGKAVVDISSFTVDDGMEAVWEGAEVNRVLPSVRYILSTSGYWFHNQPYDLS